MAEILLSLTIIGVVAAITLPSLTGNINERTWNTQRKALYARFSQAIALMPALNGYGTLDDTTDTAAETFVTAGLSKVLKINNICDSEHLGDCGIPKKLITAFGENISDFTRSCKTLGGLNSKIYHSDFIQPDTKAAAFETANGESIMAYYNPRCTGNSDLPANKEYIQKRMCVNFVYDLNGSKGPNTVGKDIGVITVFNPTDSTVVLPHFRSNGVKGAWEGFYANSFYEGNTINLSAVCREKLGDEYRPPNIYELASLFLNETLFQVTTRTGVAISFSKVLKSAGEFYQLGLNNTVEPYRVRFYSSGSTQGFTVHCIER